MLFAAIAIAVGGGSWAVNRREKPRDVQARVISGTPAKKTTSTGQIQRWQQSEVTVQVDRRLARLGDGAAQAVERAFSAWSAAGAPTVAIEIGTDLTVSMVPDGVNAVVLAPITVPGHRNDLAVTIGFSDTNTGEIVEADVMINTNYPIEPLVGELGPVAAAPSRPTESDRPQSTDRSVRLGDEANAHGLEPSCSGNPARAQRCGERYDLESILAHEAGHFFGLGEDETDGHATMFYCTSACETHKRSLERTDIQAMTEVYAAGLDSAPEVRCAAASDGAARSTLLQVVSLLAFLGLLARHQAAPAPMRQRRR